MNINHRPMYTLHFIRGIKCREIHDYYKIITAALDALESLATLRILL